MPSPPHPHHSHLFTVRVWCEVGHDGEVEWRGLVRHVLSGEWRYFRDWKRLNHYLMTRVEEGAVSSSATDR